MHAADALRANTEAAREGGFFWSNEYVAKDYQIDETETDLRLYVPPPNVSWKVAVATAIASSSLWFAGVNFYLSLARSESNWMFLYVLAYNGLALSCVAALRVLYRQLAAKEIIFERHVIGVDYRILGMRVRQRWFSVHRVQQWITAPDSHGTNVLLAIRYQDRTVKLVETLDPDLWLGLVVRMQRKEFVYV